MYCLLTWWKLSWCVEDKHSWLPQFWDGSLSAVQWLSWSSREVGWKALASWMHYSTTTWEKCYWYVAVVLLANIWLNEWAGFNVHVDTQYVTNLASWSVALTTKSTAHNRKKDYKNVIYIANMSPISIDWTTFKSHSCEPVWLREKSLHQ